MMIRTKLVTLLILIAAFALSLAGQEKPSGPAAPSVPGVREFPVTLKQSVTAGKTAVGTKIEAELAVATLVDGKVIPRNAVLSGEVIASSGKSKTDPSRLGIRDRLGDMEGRNGADYGLFDGLVLPFAAMSPDRTCSTVRKNLHPQPGTAAGHIPPRMNALTNHSLRLTLTRVERCQIQRTLQRRTIRSR